MKKYLNILLALILMFTLAACDKDNSDDNTPVVNNPPQSDQLSYETNKNGYITSCTLSIDNETFTYQCEGENYLLIDNTNGKYVISEEAPVTDNYIGASSSVKRIYFYEGTAQEFVIQDFLPDDIGVVGTRIQVFNRAGEIVVDQTPRQSIESLYFSLGYQPGVKTPLLDTSKDALLTGDAQDLGYDENAITIEERIFEKTENGGIMVRGDLTSTTFYDTETGKVIYSCIYNIDASYTINIYDRNDYHLVYQEINDYETLSERIYNADGSYSETVTDMNTMKPISQGDYNSDGTPIA